MSTSLLYHGFGIRGYDYVRTEYHHGQVFFTIRQDGDTLKCSACGSRDLASRGHADRRFKSLPIGGKPVSIVFPIRRSFDKANNKAAIHMVSAWSETNRIVLGQLATDAKNNEIKAIPRLLEMLDIEDSVVTIDAMGCQKAIAEKILDQKGDYVLQVKKNQDKLHDLLKETFDELTSSTPSCIPHPYHEETDADHGRVEVRRVWMTDWTGWYQKRSNWAGLQSFICVESERTVNDRTSVDRRYYISSLSGQKPETMLCYVRGHWGIENRLHWSLDMSFREDAVRARIGHSAENLSRMRRLILNLLKQDKSTKASIDNKRFKACMENEYLLKILRIPI